MYICCWDTLYYDIVLLLGVRCKVLLSSEWRCLLKDPSVLSLVLQSQSLQQRHPRVHHGVLCPTRGWRPHPRQLIPQRGYTPNASLPFNSKVTWGNWNQTGFMLIRPCNISYLVLFVSNTCFDGTRTCWK